MCLRVCVRVYTAGIDPKLLLSSGPRVSKEPCYHLRLGSLTARLRGVCGEREGGKITFKAKTVKSTFVKKSLAH